MTATTARAVAPSPAVETGGPLDLHDVYQERRAAGYDCAITLSPIQLQHMVASLRGISAATAVLVAGFDTTELSLGEWLQCGLVDAIDELAFAMSCNLEEASEHAQKVQGGQA